MIPLKDLNRSYSPPVITVFIIIANISAFIYMYYISGAPSYMVKQYALFPSDFLNLSIRALDNNIKEADYKFLPDFISSMFMHGSIMHLLGNLWFLWIFGDNVESVMGKIQFAFFYLICGITAAVVHSLVSPSSNIPIIGASGAIAGVMGAYLILFPNAKILTFVPFFLIWLLPIPAFIFLILWFAGQLLNGIYNLDRVKGISNIAFWAHIGGFLIGILFGIIFRGKNKRLARRAYSN